MKGTTRSDQQGKIKKKTSFPISSFERVEFMKDPLNSRLFISL